MPTHDVVVVGGGPAGSSCARALVAAGLDVCVIDRAAFPRDKVCAGWITPPVVEALDLDVGDYGASRVLQPVSGFEVGVLGGAVVRCEYGRTVSYAIRRCEFDDYLLRRSGARLRLGEPVAAVERDGGGWRINGELRATVVVGAGGHACPVAAAIGGVRRDERPIAAQEIEFRLQDAGEGAGAGGAPRLLFCRDLLGYGWCVRKDGYLNVGLGRLDGHGLAEHVREFWRLLAEARIVPRDPPGRLRGHAYLARSASRRRPIADGAVLIGDAAGLADARSGEGILPAVESGLLAAAVIVAARGDATATRLASYESALRSRWGSPGTDVDASPPSGIRAAAARWLLAQPGFVRRVVLDRWFLHRERAPLRIDAERRTAA